MTEKTEGSEEGPTEDLILEDEQSQYIQTEKLIFHDLQWEIIVLSYLIPKFTTIIT